MEETAYAMRVRTSLPFEAARAHVISALAGIGFGVLWEIDVRAKLKEKLGVEHPPYVILGACNPKLAHRALSLEREVGPLLPCNVIVYEEGAGSVVSILDPARMMALAKNPALEEVAAEARRLLRGMLEKLFEGGGGWSFCQMPSCPPGWSRGQVMSPMMNCSRWAASRSTSP